VKLVHIEHAIGMLRKHLMECVVREDWSEQRSQELSEITSACFRSLADEHREMRVGPRGGIPCERLRRAMRYVNDHLDSKLRWDELAATLGLGVFAFARRFKLGTGLTPHQYIIHCRLERAMKLLSQSEMRLAEIAVEVGCCCQSHLTTLFRKHLNTTPGEYRQSRARAASKSERLFGSRSRDVAGGHSHRN
jgi:transcriptional regulator GlxA family with amidase domain